MSVRVHVLIRSVIEFILYGRVITEYSVLPVVDFTISVLYCIHGYSNYILIIELDPSKGFGARRSQDT